MDLRRRRFIRAAAAAGIVGAAGCLGEGEPEEEPEDGGDTDTEEERGGDGGLEVFREEDYEMPRNPEDADFVDRTGEDTVEVETAQREFDPEFVFDPPFVRVSQGTTVRWVNGDGVFHSVTSTDDGLESVSPSGDFNDQINAMGDEFEWVAEETGRQHYYCTPHAGFMYGIVEVV